MPNRRSSGFIKATGLWLGDAGDDIHEILGTARQAGATDVHIVSGAPIFLRIDGELTPYTTDSLSSSASKHLSYALLSNSQVARFEESSDLDIMTTDDDRNRYRVNVSFNNGSIGAVIRLLPREPLTLPNLRLPPIVESWSNANKGLILVTGSTSQGKTTTTASMIDYINSHRRKHIITIEDPIEYLHENKQSVVRQREIGRDTDSFHTGLRAALRQDPDVIFIGEMRDFETIMIALRAAETGILVLSTLHVLTIEKVVDRLSSYAPPEHENLLRTMLAEALLGAIHQELLSTKDGGKRVACEVLVGSPAVRNMFRSRSDHQIRSAMEMGAKIGMRTMETSLKELLAEDEITEGMYRDVMQSYAKSHAGSE